LSLFWIVVTALLWGVTDPLLKRFGEGIASDSVFNLTTNSWRYALAFLANQCGSLTYIFALSTGDLSITVPAANGLKFGFTLLMGRMLGEEDLDARRSAGLALIFLGIMIQVT